MKNKKRVIITNLTNVSREEQQELKTYLEDNCWSFKEEIWED